MRNYWLLLQWQVRQIIKFIPLLVVLQITMSAGTVLGFSTLR